MELASGKFDKYRQALTNGAISDAALQKSVDYINSGKDPKFPGAQQRVSVEDVKKAHTLLQEEMRNPDSKLHKAFDVLETRSNEAQAKFEKSSQALRENPSFWNKVKRIWTSITSVFSFKRKVNSDIEAIK